MKLLYIALFGLLFSPLTVLAAEKSHQMAGLCPPGYTHDVNNHLCWKQAQSPCQESEGFYYSNTLQGCAKCPAHTKWDEGSKKCQPEAGKKSLPLTNLCNGLEVAKGKNACMRKIAPPCPEHHYYNKKYGSNGACTVCATDAQWDGNQCVLK